MEGQHEIDSKPVITKISGHYHQLLFLVISHQLVRMADLGVACRTKSYHQLFHGRGCVSKQGPLHTPITVYQRGLAGSSTSDLQTM
jgi:hypothetical protein